MYNSSKWRTTIFVRINFVWVSARKRGRWAGLTENWKCRPWQTLIVARPSGVSIYVGFFGFFLLELRMLTIMSMNSGKYALVLKSIRMSVILHFRFIPPRAMWRGNNSKSFAFALDTSLPKTRYTIDVTTSCTFPAKLGFV